MKCHSVRKKLSAYQDRELKSGEQEEISRHLLSCQFCREQYAEFERVWQTLGELEEIRPDPWFCGQVIGRIKKPRKHGLLPGLQWSFRVLRAPATVSILLTVGILVGVYLGNVMIRSDFFPFGNTATSHLQEAFLDSLKVFDPAPPGTLAQGYMQMAGYKGDESR
jgi:predicted anti-sigma-YlaC factor YlaD